VVFFLFSILGFEGLDLLFLFGEVGFGLSGFPLCSLNRLESGLIDIKSFSVLA